MGIDLDAAKSARREAMGTAPSVTFGGREFGLPPELPFPVVLLLADLAEAQGAGDIRTAAGVIAKIIRAILGESFDAFMEAGPSLADLEEMLRQLMAEYGVTPGEAPASESSSARTSRPSKPISSVSTA